VAQYGGGLWVVAVIHGFDQVGKLAGSVCFIAVLLGVKDVPESDGGVVC